MPRNKVDTKKLALLPVPEGLTIRYHHNYDPPKFEMHIGDEDDAEPYPVRTDGPHKLISTTAYLFKHWPDTPEQVAMAMAIVNPKDVPNKKLGRAIAHNRCIKAYQKAQHQN